MSKLIVICLVGAPCSGKSTWVNDNLATLAERHKTNVVIISRDDIRDALFGDNYVINSKDEKLVTEKFYKQLGTATSLEEAVIILDNTHMHDYVIRAYMTTFQTLMNSGKLEFYVEFFKIPYWKAWIRNWKRKILKGKWIPLNVLNDFYDRYGVTIVDINKYPSYSKKYGK